MTKKNAILWMILIGVFGFGVGAAGGMLVIYAKMKPMQEADTATWQTAANTCQQAINVWKQADESCRKQLEEMQSQMTVLFDGGEPPPTLSIGPWRIQARWMIPAKVKPMATTRDIGGMGYYYVNADGKWDGPYLPQLPPQK